MLCSIAYFKDVRRMKNLFAAKMNTRRVRARAETGAPNGKNDSANLFCRRLETKVE